MTDPPAPVADIDPAQARRLMEAGAFLLDVREDEEWSAGHSPDARHIPMGSVADRMTEIPSNRTVVCVCRVGGRSAAVASALADAGYDVRNLEGGMMAWEAAGFPVVDDAGNTGHVV